MDFRLSLSSNFLRNSSVWKSKSVFMIQEKLTRHTLSRYEKIISKNAFCPVTRYSKSINAHMFTEFIFSCLLYELPFIWAFWLIETVYILLKFFREIQIIILIRFTVRILWSECSLYSVRCHQLFSWYHPPLTFLGKILGSPGLVGLLAAQYLVKRWNLLSSFILQVISDDYLGLHSTPYTVEVIVTLP